MKRVNMDDNIWEYPFGDLDDDDEIFFRKPACTGKVISKPAFKTTLNSPGLSRSTF